MGLEEIFAPFQEALGGEAVCRFVGPDRADDNSRAPRISWDPVQAEHKDAVRVTGAAGDDGPFSTRQWAIKVEVWEFGLPALEGLVNLFLATARKLLSKFSFRPGPEVWKTGGVTAGYMVAELVIFLAVPVLKVAQPYRRITEIDVTSDMGGAGTTTDNITG